MLFRSNGFEDLSMVVCVMDGYHVEKRIRSFACKFPKKNVATRIKTAIRVNDKKRADEILQSLYDVCEDEKQTKSVEEFGRYLMGNWKEIVSYDSPRGFIPFYLLVLLISRATGC